jgi:hypothetical protein
LGQSCSFPQKKKKKKKKVDKLAERDHAAVPHWVARARVCEAEGCSIALPRYETLD